MTGLQMIPPVAVDISSELLTLFNFHSLYHCLPPLLADPPGITTRQNMPHFNRQTSIAEPMLKQIWNNFESSA